MKTINDQNYQQILNENSVVLVDFSAAWCGPCNNLAPTIEKLAKEYEGKAAVCTCNIDECPELVSKSGIRNIPTLFFYKNGEFQNRLVGSVREDSIKECLDGIIKEVENEKQGDTKTL